MSVVDSMHYKILYLVSMEAITLSATQQLVVVQSTCTDHNTSLSFNGSNNFNNSASLNGGAIYTNYEKCLPFSETGNIISNSAEGSGGAIFTYASGNIVLGFSKFINNLAHSAGAIYACNTVVTLNGTIYFIKNRGRRGTVYSSYDTCGGGVYMVLESTFSILPITQVYIGRTIMQL